MSVLVAFLLALQAPVKGTRIPDDVLGHRTALNVAILSI